MAKATKQLGGAAKDKYFRELFAAPGLSPGMAKRLTELTKAEISQVRVRQPLADRARLSADETSAATAEPARTPDSSGLAPGAALPTAKSDESAKSAEPRPASAPDAGFDPFAFTAVVVLKRQGAAALMRKLEDISEPSHLRLLADKQHLGVPADANDAAALRAAIIAAAQTRLDDRRAAAS